MAIYRGYGGVNREIKQQFRGFGGVNREIKEQYRGYGGVNRLIFNGGTPSGALYWLGNLCSTLTGGWDNRSFVGIEPTYTFNSTYITISGQGNASYGSNGFVITTNMIDLTNYTTLHFIFTLPTATNGTYSIRIGTSTSLASNYTENIHGANGVVYSDQTELTYDVSSLDSSYYIGLGIEGGVNNSVTVNYYKVWLT